MTTLYLIRHGESVSNMAGTFTGQAEAPLTEKGRLQARLCAKALKDVPFEAAYASDLGRAYETGTIIAATHKLVPVGDVRLREIDGGLFQTVTFDEIGRRFPEEYGLWRRNIGHVRCPGGESTEEVASRVYEALSEIASRHDGGHVLIATHATPIRAFKSLVTRVGLDGMQSVPWCGNASINVYTYENGVFSLIRDDDCAHLADLRTDLPKNI